MNGGNEKSQISIAHFDIYLIVAYFIYILIKCYTQLFWIWIKMFLDVICCTMCFFLCVCFSHEKFAMWFQFGQWLSIIFYDEYIQHIMIAWRICRLLI